MTVSNDPVAPSAFDADAFNLPFYRVHRIDETLQERVKALVQDHDALIIDAKVPASDVAAARVLWSLGFRKVCMQVTLCRALGHEAVPASTSVANVSPRLDLDDTTVMRHARNFTFDRFSLDPLLSDEGVRRLYFRWIRNSLGGARQVVHVGDDFCTMTSSAPSAKIDLVSVLNPGQGRGRVLVEGACALAHTSGADRLLVTTECENTRAWTLYQRCGFLPLEFTSVFHLVCGR
jgi:ribosomal protein S18 acetylase RimI-like enzyme